MSKYSSILFVPDKFHHIGPFRFPVFEDLTPGEAKGIEMLTRKQSKQTFKSIRLAQQIAKDKKITTKEAIDMMSNLGDNDSEDLAIQYSKELEQLQSEGVSAVEQQIDFVTLVMQYRGEAQIKGKWQSLKDWSEDDTDSMPSKLLEQVFEFVIWERDGWPTEGKPEAE